MEEHREKRERKGTWSKEDYGVRREERESLDDRREKERECTNERSNSLLPFYSR